MVAAGGRAGSLWGVLRGAPQRLATQARRWALHTAQSKQLLDRILCAEVSPRDGQGLVVGHGRLRQPQLSPRLKSRGLELQCLSSQVVPRPNGCRFLASELLAGWATGTARMALRIIYYALHGGVAERKHSMGALALFAME